MIGFYSIADHVARQRSEGRKEKQKDRYQELQMEIAPKKRQVHQNSLTVESWVDEEYRDRMQSERVTAPLVGSPAGKRPPVPRDVRKAQRQEKKKASKIAAKAARKGTKRKSNKIWISLWLFDFTHSVVSVSILYLKINFSHCMFPITFCDLYLVYTIRNSQTPIPPELLITLYRVARLQVINGELKHIYFSTNSL